MFDLLRRYPDVRRLWIAQIVSYCGDWFATVALLGIVSDLTGSALAASLVLVSQTIPSFVMSPLAGVSADRFDRRRIMVVISASQALAALGFLAIGPGRVWMAFVAQGAVSALAAFFGPASQASLPNLIEPDDLARASALMGATWGSMLAIGAGLGGGFTALFGRHAAFIADALSFVVAGVLVWSIRGATQKAERKRGHGERRLRPIADTAEAIAHARQDRRVATLLASKFGYGLGAGVVGLLAVLATKRFGAGDGGTGLLLAGRGVGVVIGPVAAARLADTTRVRPIMWWCGASGVLYGAAYVGVAWAPNLALAIPLVLVAHLGGGTQWTMSTIGLQLVTPDALRGRILAADYALVTLMLSLSYTLSGLAAEHVSTSVVITVLGVVSIVWGAFYLTLSRRY